MTQPDSDSRQALIERLGYLTTLPREAWGIADDADIVPITVGELRTVVLALRQADEEIERVKKGYQHAAEQANKSSDDCFRLSASLSAVTLRNEKLREALQPFVEFLRDIHDDVPGDYDGEIVLLESPSPPYQRITMANLLAARAALQLSPDPATPQETKA